MDENFLGIYPNGTLFTNSNGQAAPSQSHMGNHSGRSVSFGASNSFGMTGSMMPNQPHHNQNQFGVPQFGGQFGQAQFAQGNMGQNQFNMPQNYFGKLLRCSDSVLTLSNTVKDPALLLSSR
jgi:hypothetical protein